MSFIPLIQKAQNETGGVPILAPKVAGQVYDKAADINCISSALSAIIDDLVLICGGTDQPSKGIATIISDMANLLDTANALQWKTAIDCSGNPNYPAASCGWVYMVSVGGKIGGVNGIAVDAFSLIICNTDNTASGNQATVGSYWNIINTRIIAATTSNAGVVQLSNSYTGNSETKATTEKALSDGLGTKAADSAVFHKSTTSEILGLTEQPTPAAGDFILAEKGSDGSKVKIQFSKFGAGAG